MKTQIATEIDSASYDARYDAHCKSLLSHRIILAHIMKGCVEEFKDFDVNYIADNCIDGVPQVSNVAVHQNSKPEKIVGANSEDKTVDEGIVFFDIRFVAVIPQTGENIRLIINIEAQNEHNPGYSLIKRGLYYCSRLVSAQKETEFANDNYDDIKKVYSIWICTNAPEYACNSINKYCITEKHLIGNFTEEPEKYDLLNVIMVRLAKDSENTDGMNKNILKLLRVLLSGKVEADRKKEILNNDFDIKMSVELEKEMRGMCNLSAEIRADGVEEGIRTGEILTTVKIYQKLGTPVESIVKELMEMFQLSEKDAKEKVKEYWK